MVKRGRDLSAWGRSRPAPSTAVVVDDIVSLPVPAEVAWAWLLDVDAVASCLPGLVPETLQSLDDGQYQARVQATAFGVTANWEMNARLVADESRRRLAIELAGNDHRLGLRLDGTADLEVQRDGNDSAQLIYRGRVEVRGRLAAAGGPVITTVVENMVHRFVHSLSGATASPPRRLRRIRVILAGLAAWLHRLAARRSGESGTQPER
jgi:carbon monoxide dehydrogenase subunit G